jgi:hypothetical protein
MHLQETVENKFYVYALIDPVNRIPFYIGKGQGDRAYHHLRPAEKWNQRKLVYIKSIRGLGFEPGVKFIIKGITEKDAYDIEISCIQLASKIGISLTNSVGIDPPNRTGKRMPESAKRRISEFQKSRLRGPMKEATKRLLSEVHRGRSSYPSIIVTCPHCYVAGSNRAMYRWHFAKCKSQKV